MCISQKNDVRQEFVKTLATELTKGYDVVDLRAMASVFTAKAHEKAQAQKGKKKKGAFLPLCPVRF